MFRSLIGSVVLTALVTASAAGQQVWNLVDDWEIYDQGRAHTPNNVLNPDEFFFGPESDTIVATAGGVDLGSAWSIRETDGSTTPTLAFTDVSDNYFTPGSQQWIAGYTSGNQAATFKVYANMDPWLDAQLGNLENAERAKPESHNFDPDSGALDLGDIGVVPGGGGGTGQIVWRAPRDMTIEASYDAYSVGTMLPVGATPDPNNPTTQSVRIHFLVRDAPGTGPINPEGEPDVRLNGFIPQSLGGNGREFLSQSIAPFDVTAGQEVYIKINPINPFPNSSRNLIGFSSLEVREVIASIVDGDFNNDEAWDCLDIDALTDAVATGSTDLAFDMNGDGSITFADVTDAGDGWLAVGGAENAGATGGNPFLVGDATLDGTVDGADFDELNSNLFTSNTAWCNGNFNGDLLINGRDFLEWNATKFTSSDNFSAVPEPVLPAHCLFFIAIISARRYGRRG